MDLTGGGAFNNLTPESVLEDLGANEDSMSFRTTAPLVCEERALQGRVLAKSSFGISDLYENKGVNVENPRPTGEGRVRGQSKQEINPQNANILEQSYSSKRIFGRVKRSETRMVLVGRYSANTPNNPRQARVSSRLDNETGINQKLDSRTQGFENDVVCHSERSEESQSLTQRNDCTLTPTTSPNLRGEKKPAFTLAEGATHVDMFHAIRKPAFTLAEVLVTLGIIGVVAAMTLPMLAKNYQFFIRQQQFKKAYAELSIAVQKTQIDMGENVRCYYSSDTSKFANNWDDCRMFFPEVAKSLNVIKACEGNARQEKCLPDDMRGGEVVYLENHAEQGMTDEELLEKFNSGCKGYTTKYLENYSLVYLLNSGYRIMTYSDANGRKAGPHMLVDVNGNKSPNKWGHDIFVFRLVKVKQYDSITVLQPFQGCHPLEEGGYYTPKFFNYLYGQSSEL